MSTGTEPTPNLGNTLPTLDSQIDHELQLSYWSSQTADVNGMLGGYPQVSRIDLQGSKNFIAKVRRISRLTNSNSTSASTDSSSAASSNGSEKAPIATSGQTSGKEKVPLAVDCGAGIGRITEGLLVNIADVVDIVEPVEKFAAVIQASDLKREGKVGDVYVQGLEKWTPSKKYHLAWNQWCLGHLTDAQVVEYLKRAASALVGYPEPSNGDAMESEGQGWIMVKENLSTDQWGEDIFDDVDSSITRSDEKFKNLFEEAGLDIIKMEVQKGFPKSLYPVKMYALRPK